MVISQKISPSPQVKEQPNGSSFSNSVQDYREQGLVEFNQDAQPKNQQDSPASKEPKPIDISKIPTTFDNGLNKQILKDTYNFNFQKNYIGVYLNTTDENGTIIREEYPLEFKENPKSFKFGIDSEGSVYMAVEYEKISKKSSEITPKDIFTLKYDSEIEELGIVEDSVYEIRNRPADRRSKIPQLTGTIRNSDLEQADIGESASQVFRNLVHESTFDFKLNKINNLYGTAHISELSLQIIDIQKNPVNVGAYMLFGSANRHIGSINELMLQNEKKGWFPVDNEK